MTEREALATFLMLKMVCNRSDVPINQWHTWNRNFIWPRESPDELSSRTSENVFRQEYRLHLLCIMKAHSCCGHHGNAVVALGGRLVGVLHWTFGPPRWVLADLVTGTVFQFTEASR